MVSANPTTFQILVMDDDVALGELLKTFLEASGPFYVEQIMRSTDLPGRLAAKSFHLMLLDYHLPDTTGIDILETLNTAGNRMPVIMMTGKGDQRTAAHAIQLGASDYLVKGDDFWADLPNLILRTIRMSELQEANRRSLEQIRFQSLVLENIRDAVVVWNLDGQIIHWNAAAYVLFGFKPQEMLGKPVERSYLSYFRPQFAPPRVNDTASAEIEHEFFCPSGRRLWVSSRLMPLRSPDGNHELLGYMDVARDITERKAKDARIRKAQMQLAEAARLSAIGQLATGVAHQISNPLTAILGETQLLLHDLSNEDASYEPLKTIEAAGWRAQWAVQALNRFAEPPDGTIGSVDLCETIQLAVTLVGANLLAKGMQVDTKLPSGAPKIRANAHQIESLWVNLLLFIRSMINTSTSALFVHIEDKPGARAEVVFEVQGIVIKDEQIRSVFQPDLSFLTAEDISGMEITVCHEIVRQNQGSIEFQRGQDLSIIRVFLPKEL